jgi:mono/diheme cytochrome c family protein
MSTTMGMTHRCAVTALAALVCCATAHAQDGASAQRGKAKYELSCAPCHADGPGDDGRPMLPGTEALTLKYRGSIPAVLEQRTDLTAPVIKAFVRTGTFSMPPFRKTELTDTEIEDIAAYIAETSKQPR